MFSLEADIILRDLFAVMQAEVTTLSQQVGLCDHQRAILTAENVLLKQKLTSLGQTQRFKEGECFFGVLSNWVYLCNLVGKNVISMKRPFFQSYVSACLVLLRPCHGARDGCPINYISLK